MSRPRRSTAARLTGAVAAVAALALAGQTTASAAGVPGADPGRAATYLAVAPAADRPTDSDARRHPAVPYRLDGPLPKPVSSPPVRPDAPYTPLVKSLIEQLLPTTPPTPAQLANAARLFQGVSEYLLGPITGQPGGPNIGPQTCGGIGGVFAPVGTTPSISDMCWADAVGVNIIRGPNVNRSTATPQPLALAASFDRRLNNAWGQVEGLEARRLMVTGLLGPQADILVQQNWKRGLDTLGEDPFLVNELAGEQTHGAQGRGAMAQVKHLAGFSGTNQQTAVEIDDQAMHEIWLQPFEKSIVDAKAASVMCSYNAYRVTSDHLPERQRVLYRDSPYADTDIEKSTRSWPLDETHWACEQPFALKYVLRTMWRSVGFVGSDYPSTHSTGSFVQGMTQEFPLSNFFGPNDPTDPQPPIYSVGRGHNPSGSDCVLAATATPVDCSADGARHVGGLPGAGCNPANGCGLVSAVTTGALPVAVFKQGLAEVLYQQERFGLLGCDDTPVAETCTNPGGVGGDRTGTAPLPVGPRGATARDHLGTKHGDAAVVERAAEEGAVLLKNRDAALPLTGKRLRRGVSVAGGGAHFLIGSPFNETSLGFPDRTAVGPLLQLRRLAPRGSRIDYTAAYDPAGIAVPTGELSSVDGRVTGGLTRTAGPGAPRRDTTLDRTSKAAGRLAPGEYTWSGYVRVPRTDTYVFRFQHTPGTTEAPDEPVQFTLDGQEQELAAATRFYCGHNYGRALRGACVNNKVTVAGHTEPGLTNVQAPPVRLSAGYHPVEITFRNNTDQPAAFRFARSRDLGDARDAATAARSAATAVVFVNDHDIKVIDQSDATASAPDTPVASLPREQVRLIRAVAKANPRTVVVLNTTLPVIVQPWFGDRRIKAVLQMWAPGSEGGTATARLLLGHASPTGHLPLTWPRAATDTLWAHPQQRRMFPGDALGRHPERLNGVSDAGSPICDSYLPATTQCTKTVMSQGIFSGYRFYDAQRLEPQFPFGYGLTYGAAFRYSNLSLARAGRSVVARFTVTNTGRRRGTDVAQVYVGPGPARAGVQQAVRSLRGFERVTVPAGRSVRVTIRLAPRSFQYWSSPAQAWRTNSGPRTIFVGNANSPEHLPLRGRVTIR